MDTTYRIRPAEPDDPKDFTAVLHLINSAAHWLQTEKHTNQWEKPWPDRQARDERVINGISAGLTWLAEDGDTVVGTVTCRELGTDYLWSPAELAEPAVYVSRLIVSRNHTGRGIGAALVDWAGLRGVRQWQANWIRVDVWTTNNALHGYYKKQGFTHLRTKEVAYEWEYPSAALFQKPASQIDPRAAARFIEA